MREELVQSVPITEEESREVAEERLSVGVVDSVVSVADKISLRDVAVIYGAIDPHDVSSVGLQEISFTGLRDFKATCCTKDIEHGGVGGGVGVISWGDLFQEHGLGVICLLDGEPNCVASWSIDGEVESGLSSLIDLKHVSAGSGKQ